MANTGQVFATDRDRGRLAPIYDRLKRAGTRNVQVRPAGRALDDLAGKLDAVLIDAPCTGTGTWRRRPDAKWRVRAESLSDRVREQRELLANAAALVGPSARIVYITCSFLADENTGQVDAFLNDHPDFGAIPGETVAAAVGLVDVDGRQRLPGGPDDALARLDAVDRARKTAVDGGQGGCGGRGHGIGDLDGSRCGIRGSRGS